MAEDEIIKHTKAAYQAWKDPEKDWWHKFKDVLLEVMIIVFAVTLSIWLHNWSEDMKDRKAEKAFFTGLKEDIQADLIEMKSDRDNLKKAYTGVLYFEGVGRGKPLSNDSLNKYVWIFFSGAQINPRISRFEALKGSGKLDIIENKKLLYRIIDLYQKAFPQIFRLNSMMNTLMTDKLDPYLSDTMALDLKGSPTNAEKILRTSKMRILLMQAEGFRNSVAGYSDGINQADEIIKEIDQEIK